MKDIAVLPGPSSTKLGTSIASYLNVDPVDVELRTLLKESANTLYILQF